MFQFLVLTEQDDIWGQYIVIKSVVFEKNKTIIYIYICLYTALRCDGMTAADGNIGPAYFEPHDIFHKTRKHFPLPLCPACARASRARAGMFISNLPAGRAPRRTVGAIPYFSITQCCDDPSPFIL